MAITRDLPWITWTSKDETLRIVMVKTTRRTLCDAKETAGELICERREPDAMGVLGWHTQPLSMAILCQAMEDLNDDATMLEKDVEQKEETVIYERITANAIRAAAECALSAIEGLMVGWHNGVNNLASNRQDAMYEAIGDLRVALGFAPPCTDLRRAGADRIKALMVERANAERCAMEPKQEMRPKCSGERGIASEVPPGAKVHVKELVESARMMVETIKLSTNWIEGSIKDAAHRIDEAARACSNIPTEHHDDLA